MIDITQRKSLAKWVPWIIFILSALFYSYSVLARMLPSTMTDIMMGRFHLNAGQFGLFTALYYYSYVILQIPAGLIADRVPIKKVILSAIVIAAAGILVTALATNIYVAGLGRIIVGIGCAFAYICALKTASLWLPREKFGIASCITDTIGMISGLLIGLYLTDLNLQIGITQTELLIVLLGVVLMVLITLIVKSKKPDNGQLQTTQPTQEKESICQQLKVLVSNRQIWLIGIVGCLYYLPSSVFLDVWGISYLSHVYQLSIVQASHITALFSLGWMIAGAGFGYISDKWRSRKMPILVASVVVMLLFALVVLPPYFFGYHIPIMLLSSVMFLIGVFTSPHPLVFALAKENYRSNIAATVVGATNMIIMLGGIIFQPLVGLLMNLHRYLHHEAHTSASHYSSGDYSFGMLVLPVFLLISIIVTYFIRDRLNDTVK